MKRPQIQYFTDEELVRHFQQEAGNDYLAELFERYLRFVFLICMKYLRDEELSKDISMNVFMKLTDDLKRFEINNFKSWLHVVTKNTCMMHLRTAKQHRHFSLDSKFDGSAVMENTNHVHPEEVNSKEMQLELLEKAMATLDTEQKQCVELFFLHDKSYVEVADSTGFSMNQVKSYIQNGKRNLKNYMLSQGDLMLFIFTLLYLNK